MAATCDQCQVTNGVEWYRMRMHALRGFSEHNTLVYTDLCLCRPHRAQLHEAIEAALAVARGEKES
jgi:hypothetical protein